MAADRSGTPLYRTLAHRLQERIDSGTYPAGARLPSEPELSAEFGVNRLTVRQAVAELERAAAVEIRRGVGTFVRGPAVRVSIDVDPRSRRVDVGSTSLALPGDGEQPGAAGEFVVAAPKVTGSAEDREAARQLGRPLAALFRVDTVTRLDGRAGAVSSYWVAFGPLPAELVRPGRAGNLVQDLARAGGIQLEYDWRAFGAIGADLADAELLGVPVGAPLLVREGVSCTPEGTAALYVRRRIDGRSARFVLRYREHDAEYDAGHDAGRDARR
ncbi:GntR family transcriptional regulator [Kitasatospora sp. NPDC059795]|uniref:GntR family transcriptional regulator n=1 Tax=Kitasatospora sp. NPDC059795 TaxID=3346949 RepID=UPI00365A2091